MVERLDETNSDGRIYGEQRDFFLTDVNSGDEHVRDLWLTKDAERNDTIVMIVCSVLFLVGIGVGCML